MSVRELADFDRDVLGSPVPVLVDFHAPWCGPCRVQAPMLEALGQEAEGRYDIVKVNVDEHAELARRFAVASIPTLLVFVGGKPVRHLVGLQSAETLRRALAEAGALAA